VGAIVAWALIGLLVAIKAPGASYLFIWPALFAGLAAIAPRWSRAVEWFATAMTILLLVGLAHGVSVIILGVAGPGAIVLGVITALVALLALPQLETVGADAKWLGARWVAVGAAAFVVIGALVTRWSADRPIPTALAYAENADSTGAWFGTFAGFTDDWSKRASSPAEKPPAWTARIAGRGIVGHAVTRVPLEAPTATFVRDTTIGNARRVVLRVHAPSGTTSLVMRAIGTRVLSSSIDGRVVDTTRYRRHLSEWTMPFWAMPDSGAVVALSVPLGTRVALELIARRPGIPKVPGLTVPPRPPDVVPIQFGDASYVYRRLTF
jgi:hypothetical protein